MQSKNLSKRCASVHGMYLEGGICDLRWIAEVTIESNIIPANGKFSSVEALFFWLFDRLYIQLL